MNKVDDKLHQIKTREQQKGLKADEVKKWIGDVLCPAFGELQKYLENKKGIESVSNSLCAIRIIKLPCKAKLSFTINAMTSFSNVDYIIAISASGDTGIALIHGINVFEDTKKIDNIHGWSIDDITNNFAVLLQEL